MPTISRRTLLQLATLPLLQDIAPLWARSASARRILVLVELQGGNDGLNTLIPYEDSAYYRLRPRIGIRKPLKLGDGMGIHPALAPLMPAWLAGEMCWIRGLGYPEPNRSHFRSIEIWETGSGSRQQLHEGWLSRILPADGTLQAIVIGDDAGPLAGNRINVAVLTHLDHFLQRARGFGEVNRKTSNPALAHVLRIHDRIHDNAALLAERLRNSASFLSAYPRHRFGKSMAAVTRILLAGVQVSVLKVGIRGFDTHVNQQPRHARVLRQLAESLAIFRTIMQQAGLWDHLMVVTYSEFGRRARENASGGTDHGTAAPHLAIGGQVKGGFVGKEPDLSRLDDKGDPYFTLDFRSLYHTLATAWLQYPSSPWAHHGQLAILH